jgi:hypothetical protein
MRLSVALSSLLGLAYGGTVAFRQEAGSAVDSAEAVRVPTRAIQMVAGPEDDADYDNIADGGASCPPESGALTASNICWYLKAVSLKFDWLAHKTVPDICSEDCYKYDEQDGRLYV